jgi:predicted alpha/beta hydrolase family esterase
MTSKYQTIKWGERKNDFDIECSLDIFISPADSNIIMITVPGVDGSIDGFNDKYKHITEMVQNDHKVAIMRMSNPFISVYFWESNVRQALDYIVTNKKMICNHDDIEIYIMAHSAGAAIVAQIAWEYPEIAKLLLINPAAKLGFEKITKGIAKFGCHKTTILIGTKDPSFNEINGLSSLSEFKKIQIIKVEGADHNFSSNAFPIFMSSASKYLFNT